MGQHILDVKPMPTCVVVAIARRIHAAQSCHVARPVLPDTSVHAQHRTSQPIPDLGSQTEHMAVARALACQYTPRHIDAGRIESANAFQRL